MSSPQMKAALGRFAGVAWYVGDFAYEAAGAGSYKEVYPFPMYMHTEPIPATAPEPPCGRDDADAAVVPTNDPW